MTPPHTPLTILCGATGMPAAPADVRLTYACDAYVTEPTVEAWRGATVDARPAQV